MNEMRKTILFAGVAVGLALIAWVTAPGKVTTDAFFDIGESFFPEFTDPTAATSMEVIEFDEETGEPIPFKVVFQDGKWTIPSHHNYPADGEERLAKTAAGFIGLKKEDFRTDNPADYEACGVIDPLDESHPSLKGRGKRVTLRGANDQVLADLIIGKELPDREKYHFVRIPDQKRVYVAKIDFEISTKFSDWIEADLLKVGQSDIQKVVLKDYSVDERSGLVHQRDVVILTKEDNTWKANNMPADKEVDRNKMNQLLRALDDLKIVGVRPKPAGISASLKKIEGAFEATLADLQSLQSKGFYFSRDGRLLSNEGELQALTKEGIEYTLRFGEVAYGRGFEVSAGSDSVDVNAPAENRYLFITAAFDSTVLLKEEPPGPKNTDFLNKADSLWTDEDRDNKAAYDKHEAWRKRYEEARKKARELNQRFADWYYVIPADAYDKLHLTRKDLLKDKPKKVKS